MRIHLGAVLVAACGGSPKAPAAPVGACPPNVSAAVTREHPDATQKACEAERKNGSGIFEVTLEMRDGSIQEMELSPDGEILVVEEVIAVTALPKSVADAFAQRYPDARPERVERITPRGRPPTFEIAFGENAATFGDDGAFIDEKRDAAD
jgi:hypothetical protein